MKKVFIDGGFGTTGLRVADRLSKREDLVLLVLDEKFRKDPVARKEKLNEADIVFLCLPDDVAKETVGMIGPQTTVIDTSSAHRTTEGWVYGFSELHGQREKIITAKRVSNPGCHAIGFISLAAPLVESKILGAEVVIPCFSLTGYSGGEQRMIAEYKDKHRADFYSAPRLYGLAQNHKHLKEMQQICGLQVPPLFTPVVADFYAGMLVCIQLSAEYIAGGIEDIHEVYRTYYRNEIIRVIDEPDETGFFSVSALSGRDDMQIAVFGNNERITLISRFDNLGKGASGAAIQNMNLLLGVNETFGLKIGG